MACQKRADKSSVHDQPADASSPWKGLMTPPEVAAEFLKMQNDVIEAGADETTK